MRCLYKFFAFLFICSICTVRGLWIGNLLLLSSWLNGKISIDVYAKLTDRYLDFTAHHDKAHKAGTERSLIHRALTLHSTEERKRKEFERTRTAWNQTDTPPTLLQKQKTHNFYFNDTILRTVSQNIHSRCWTVLDTTTIPFTKIPSTDTTSNQRNIQNIKQRMSLVVHWGNGTIIREKEKRAQKKFKNTGVRI